MKIAIYARTSTRDQHPENQLLELEEYAKRNNHTYETFQEQESTRNTRPIKYDLFTRLRNKEFDGLLIWKFDRWTRSLQELVNEVNELLEKQIAIVSLRDNLDLSNPNGKLQFHIISAFAEFERSMISDRTRLGLRRAVANGKKLGRPQGAKDKNGKRRKSGYLLRWAGKRGE